MVDHDPNPMPSALFVESCSALISDRACEPGSFDAALGQPSLCIGEQRRRDAGATGLRRDEELVELGVPDDAESNGETRPTHHSDIRKSCLKPLAEALECAESD